MTEDEAQVLYDECLDDVGLESMNLPLTPAGVLKAVDPIQYDCGFADFCDVEDIEITD